MAKGAAGYLPSSATPARANSSPRRRFVYAAIIPCFLLGLFFTSHSNGVELGEKLACAASHMWGHQDASLAKGMCTQVDALYPQQNDHAWKKFGELLDSKEFQELAIDKLSGLVQIPSESYDSMPPPGQDIRWETMGQVHEYLAKVFPRIHSTFSLTKVNTYGLLYEWTGSDKSLKPYLLAAHQDVVPVNPETLDAWTHPPYSGYFDGELIWGRGTSDDKASLAAIMLTLETLLEKEWTPTRTIVLAFGFDEEASGIHGASSLGKALEETYGRDAFAFIVDEGGGFTDVYGTVFATPGVAEKGYIDVKIDVTSPGGHSSIPPTHTTIGYLASIIAEYEKSPYPVELARGSVPHDTLLCYAAHGSDIPSSLKHAVLKSTHSDKALRKVQEQFVNPDLWYSSLVGTTQAVDIVAGGVKANALPESAYAIVNHRINTESSVNETTTRDTQTIISLARSLDLTLTAFGNDVIPASVYSKRSCHSSDKPAESTAKGHINLSLAFGHQLEPAPRTPTSGKESAPWDFLSGTIKATYNSHRGLEGADNIVVSPGMPTGNTDTKYYWNLTRHIFRYNHKNSAYGSGIASGIHTVNENIPLDHYVEIIRFFGTLVLNADEADIF
ncbi:hypothetical protein D9757_001555 [Collybiopsis confluens]|uniref:Peptidase M20 dimerisation domain-containing protein n=1 Tax=Collybiopsis confluens TaxID=2823264 RepID=A0A8H5MFU0_9AGAR|nr:hypothetical protein D9757_001555 [Collybiopsis confluens]